MRTTYLKDGGQYVTKERGTFATRGAAEKYSEKLYREGYAMVIIVEANQDAEVRVFA